MLHKTVGDYILLDTRRTMFMIHNSLLWVVLCHVKHVSVYQMLDTIIQSRFVNVILKLWL